MFFIFFYRQSHTVRLVSWLTSSGSFFLFIKRVSCTSLGSWPSGKRRFPWRGRQTRTRSGEPIWRRTNKTRFFSFQKPYFRPKTRTFAFRSMFVHGNRRLPDHGERLTRTSSHAVAVTWPGDDASHIAFLRCFCTLFPPEIPSSRT